MTFLATVVLLGVLIFVHELGHFAAAKAVGIRVERFSLGLGPSVVGFRWGETEYVLSWIPLGGYVKMTGMNDEVMDRLEGGEGEPREPAPHDFDSKPLWARAFVISAGVIMNFLFAFLAYVAAAGIWGVQLPDTARVGEVLAEQLPAGTEELAEIAPGARILRIGERPVENWRDLRAAFLGGDAGPVRIEVEERSRPLGIRIPEGEADRRRLYRSVVYWIPATIGAVNPGSPADRAGLEAGDRIVAVDGTPIDGWNDLLREVRARPGERIELRVERDGRELVRAVTPDAVRETDPTTGDRVARGQVGLYPAGGEMITLRLGPTEAVRAGASETVGVTWMIVDFLGDLLTGGISPRAVGSVFTIGEASGQAVRAGFDAYLRFMALFSINLAILNLLPIPVLDGGHLLFLGIEAVRRRPLSIEQRMRWSQVGFLVIVALMVWALSADVLRLLGL